MTTLDKDATKLRALYAQADALPELIDAELCSLIDRGHAQAEIARFFELSPQEISRRVKRHRDGNGDE